LPQINLALVFGEKSGLPFYYREIPGNIPDSKTVEILISLLAQLGCESAKLVMDRGFYSLKNIISLLEKHHFLVGVSKTLNIVKNAMATEGDGLKSFENYDDNVKIYGKTLHVKLKGVDDTLKLHLYFNAEKAASEERKFLHKLSVMQDELRSGKRIDAHKNLYSQFFDVAENGTVTPKNRAIDDKKAEFGYFALLSNENLSAFNALKIYRKKDVVEKAFANIKDRLNMRRLNVSSETSLDGKLFVEFIALIIISQMNNVMNDKNLRKQYTFHELLDTLDVIECYESKTDTHICELLEKQKTIYQAFNVDSPTSLYVGGN
jgi:transposase